jgi:hypothetical protein
MGSVALAGQNPNKKPAVTRALRCFWILLLVEMVVDA